MRCFFDGDRGDGVTVLLLRLLLVAAADGDVTLADALAVLLDAAPGDASGLDSVGRIGRSPILHIGQFPVLFFATQTL